MKVKKLLWSPNLFLQVHAIQFTIFKLLLVYFRLKKVMYIWLTCRFFYLFIYFFFFLLLFFFLGGMFFFRFLTVYVSQKW